MPENTSPGIRLEGPTPSLQATSSANGVFGQGGDSGAGGALQTWDMEPGACLTRWPSLPRTTAVHHCVAGPWPGALVSSPELALGQTLVHWFMVWTFPLCVTGHFSDLGSGHQGKVRHQVDCSLLPRGHGAHATEIMRVADPRAAEAAAGEAWTHVHQSRSCQGRTGLIGHPHAASQVPLQGPWPHRAPCKAPGPLL